MSMELEDIRFNHLFQKPSFHGENTYGGAFLSKEELCSRLIRGLQSLQPGRRRKLSEIGNIEGYHCPKRIFAPAAAAADVKKSQPRDLINTLPDELLTEVFRYVASPADRYACASVCMRWLVLQSHLHTDDIKCEEEKVAELGGGDELKRSLEGKRATDVRLALVALGTQSRGGLGKLIIKGGPRQKLSKAVSNVGMTAVGVCCKDLKVLSIWDCPKIDDNGFSWIGKGCPQLQVLNIMNCPGFGDTALEAIAAGCPLLSSLSLDGCEKVGDQGLQAVAKHCSQLSCLTVARCNKVGDAGIAAVASNCKVLKALKLEKLAIKDGALVAVAEHGSSLQKLKLLQLEKLSSEGFFSFGKSSKMVQLKHLQISACCGLTDGLLDSIGKVSKEIKFLSLANCTMLDESKLLTFVNECTFLESLHLEKCAFSASATAASSGSRSLKVLEIVKCTGMGAGFLASVSPSTSCLRELDLTGFTGLSDESLVTFLSSSGSGLTSLNLSGCAKLTNRTLAAVASFCPSLGLLTLEGCVSITDQGIQDIAQGPQPVQELNLSGCDLTDNGMVSLLLAKGSSLRTLSLAGCGRLTDGSLLFMKQACKSLEALNVKNCKGLTRAKLEWFEACVWRCHLCY